MKPSVCIAVLALVAAATPAGSPAWAVETPEAVLAGIYAEEGAVIDPAKLPAYYSRDLAPALRKDQDEEIGAIGFDWLYGAQDFDIKGLAFEEIAGGPEGSLIEARFTNFGRPAVIQWTLCRRPNGDWRVTEVSNGDWSLRALLDLPPNPTTC
jgi:hypothetical protein